ncbi:MAG: hypothetical protein AAFV93_22435, partial [Chloroflexota bacterium]
MSETLHPDAIAALVHADHGTPQDILGPQQVSPKKIIVRAFRPEAKALFIVDERKAKSTDIAMEMIDENGLFE